MRGQLVVRKRFSSGVWCFILSVWYPIIIVKRNSNNNSNSNSSNNISSNNISSNNINNAP